MPDSSRSHHHSHDRRPAAVPVRWTARVVLLAFLVVTGAATVVGVVLLWPEHDVRGGTAASAFLAPGVTIETARVDRVGVACPTSAGSGSSTPPSTSGTDAGGGSGAACGLVHVTVLSGDRSGERASVQVAPEVSRSGLSQGDRLQVLEFPPSSGARSFAFFAVDRNGSLALLLVVFVLVVAVVARVRGLLAIVGLAFGAWVLGRFMLPALLDGRPGLAVAVVGAAAIMFVVLYLAHGVSLRTSAALAGTLIGIGTTAVVGVVAIGQTRLSGISDETGSLLSSFVGELDFRGLLSCAVVVAGLGVLNDVTITQASAVWEIRGAAPTLSRRQVYVRAMRIGRDHIASTIYTIVFAYAGAALSVLLLLYFYRQPVLSLASTEALAEEVVRTLASGIGLVLAVPATTLIAVLTVARSTEDT